MSSVEPTKPLLCEMCQHAAHSGGDCEVIVGYDHMNGDHECGCPGPDEETSNDDRG
jgi:hypothetical protein